QPGPGEIARTAMRRAGQTQARELVVEHERSRQVGGVLVTDLAGLGNHAERQWRMRRVAGPHVPGERIGDGDSGIAIFRVARQLVALEVAVAKLAGFVRLEHAHTVRSDVARAPIVELARLGGRPRYRSPVEARRGGPVL